MTTIPSVTPGSLNISVLYIGAMVRSPNTRTVMTATLRLQPTSTPQR